MKIVFCDRDGVINRDSDQYVKTWEEFEFLSGSLEALAMLKDAGFSLVIVTNQSILGRGMIAPETLSRTHENMAKAVREAGGGITDIFFCPHKPADGCECRKPKPGMILSAAKKYGIDPKDAFMIGDSAKDMDAAGRAGIGKTVLVATGNGLKARAECMEKNIRVDLFCDDLLAAAKWIASQNGA
ncbi:MAG: D-glycero-beta-D-manno-heptose 1,7-bisphosphate 7-phosphatase [Deltaproteobacteria bacterium]|nr:D-glycero-beta-D-manno-heptose 1,7-bisphosphate 7-phosphatase [Deltaproteobacteria bacterium]